MSYEIYNSYTGQSPQADAYATVTVARTCWEEVAPTLKATGEDSWTQTIKVMIVR